MTPTVRVLVFGSLQLEVDVDEGLIQRCQAFGRALVAQDWSMLLTGGSRGSGSGSVEFHVASAAAKALPDAAAQAARIMTLLPEEASPNTFRLGTVACLPPGDVANRRRHLVNLANVIVTFGGGPGAADLIALALHTGRPVLPLGISGGASRAIWQQEATAKRLRQALNGALDDELIAALAYADLTTEALLEACRRIGSP